MIYYAFPARYKTGKNSDRFIVELGNFMIPLIVLKSRIRKHIAILKRNLIKIINLFLSTNFGFRMYVLNLRPRLLDCSITWKWSLGVLCRVGFMEFW